METLAFSFWGVLWKGKWYQRQQRCVQGAAAPGLGDHLGRMSLQTVNTVSGVCGAEKAEELGHNH